MNRRQAIKSAVAARVNRAYVANELDAKLLREAPDDTWITLSKAPSATEDSEHPIAVDLPLPLTCRLNQAAKDSFREPTRCN